MQAVCDLEGEMHCIELVDDPRDRVHVLFGRRQEPLQLVPQSVVACGEAIGFRGFEGVHAPSIASTACAGRTRGL